MHYHHDKHFKTYVDKLNKALEPYPEYHSWTLEELLLRLAELPKELKDAVRDNGGGVYNHDMYFDIMAPAGQSVSTAVAEAFGGVENFKKTMKEAALSRFGSGFAWLAKDADGLSAVIIALANQDNPLSQGLTPVMLLDDGSTPSLFEIQKSACGLYRPVVSCGKLERGRREAQINIPIAKSARMPAR